MMEMLYVDPCVLFLKLMISVQDYILNFNGVEAMVDALDTQFTSQYSQQEFASYTVHGVKTGQFKNAGTFSYIRVFGAGHEVPAYKVCNYSALLITEILTSFQFGSLKYGEAAFQMFDQIMSGNSLSAT